MFAYMYVGNAFYTYVGAIMTGMSFAVIDDRERYHTLRSVYVAPVDIRWYMVGRGTARFLTDSAAVVIMLLIGIVFLHLPVHLRDRPLAAFDGHVRDRPRRPGHAGPHGIEPRSASAGQRLVVRRRGGGRALSF